MGISTIQSYHGAQVFEAIGLNADFIDKYFTWTASRVGGIGIERSPARCRQRRHRCLPRSAGSTADTLDVGGQYQYRRDGELTCSTRTPSTSCSRPAAPIDYATFKEYTSSSTTRRSLARCAA